MKEEVIYKEKGRFSTSPKLEYDQYLLSLKRFVKYCNEIIFVNENGNFLLPRRRSEKSAAGTWFFGGQVLAFLKLEDSVKKTLRREAGINLPTTRFKYIGQIRHWYSGRETDNTMQDSLSEVFVVKIKDTEIKKVKLDVSEYDADSLEEYDLKKIKAIKKKMNREIILELWKRYKKLK
jgi:hypothetical protein